MQLTNPTFCRTPAVNSASPKNPSFGGLQEQPISTSNNNPYNRNNSNPEEEELWNKAKNATGAERADALVHLSYIAHSRKDFTQCLALCESAKEIYESLGAESSSAELAHVYTGISYSLSELNRNKEAAEAGRHTIELLESINSPDVLQAYRNEGQFAFDAKDYEESLKWYTKALEYADPDDHAIHKAWDLFYIGRCYLKLGRNTEAEQPLLKARLGFKEEKHLRFMCYCDEELSLLYSRIDHINLAKSHAQLALDFAETTEDEVRTYWANIRFARACYLSREFETALAHYQYAKSWEVDNSSYTHWPHVFYLENCIVDCLDNLGRYSDAEETRRRIKALSESLDMEAEEL